MNVKDGIRPGMFDKGSCDQFVNRQLLYFGHIFTSEKGPEAMWVHDIHVVMVFQTFSNIKNPTYPDPTVILLVPDIVA